jgi:hypothetical protein
MKKGLIIEVVSLEGDSLVVFYFRRVSEIWHDKMDDFCHEGLGRISSSYSIILRRGGLIRRGTIVGVTTDWYH